MSGDLLEIRTLREAARVFFSRPGPRWLAAKAVTAWSLRALHGPPRLGDVAVVAGVALYWPLQEWVLHRYLLHLEPREIGGRRVDTLFSRKHRAHHRDPRDVDLTLLPPPVLRALIPADVGLWWLLAPARRTALTGMAAMTTAALAYEWTHFLVHTSYQPRTRFFARVRRNHRNHHFRNENYWLGFTWPLVDTLLGTDPDPKSVPVSATARDLHGLGDEGAGPRR
jgi:hypothetical protein